MKLFEALDRYDKVRKKNWEKGRYLTRNKWGDVVDERGGDWLFNPRLLWDGWEEYVPILSKKEKEFLSSVINPFRDKVTDITKLEGDMEWFYSLRIRVDLGFIDDYYELSLPPFMKTSAMYKNMEVGKEYTLKELGL